MTETNVQRWSQAFLPTLREAPAEAEAASHQLMLRAGLVRKLMAGAYSYLPLGLRVLAKATRIVREEMNRGGGQELLMPGLQPADLWKQTGRYDLMREILYTFEDRHGKEVVLGPTHEEIITSIVKNHVQSYRQLPLLLYQIQTKFRDEARPRYGVVRSCEFVMKDAYSFDKDFEGLDKVYDRMLEAYKRIFSRCGLRVVICEADSGAMGGKASQEFMVPSPWGEDVVVECDAWGEGRAMSLEIAPSPVPPAAEASGAVPSPEKVPTPGKHTVEEVSQLLKVPAGRILKTLLLDTDKGIVAAVVRGDHELNPIKLARLLGCRSVELAAPAVVEKISGAPLGFAGPVGLNGVTLVVDHAAMGVHDGVSGANETDTHLLHVQPGRDFEAQVLGDIRFVTEQDLDGTGNPFRLTTTVEIGHVFKLGTHYSDLLQVKYLDEAGAEQVVVMGCYGIGVNRIVSSAIEQNHDKDGIIWPESLAPYDVLVVPLEAAGEAAMALGEQISAELGAEGLEVLLDDRPLQTGAKLKDADLIGIPWRVVIGKKGIERGEVELSNRRTKESEWVKPQGVAGLLKKRRPA
ncbi:MAG: proline--tRNA ligase [Candidatus Omnitrophica bacterium]|nr:proline--tRNA ligase [Candidatus Omnitrophota bacterium]